MSAYKPGAQSQRDEAVDSLAAVWQLQEPSLWYLLGRKAHPAPHCIHFLYNHLFDVDFYTTLLGTSYGFPPVFPSSTGFFCPLYCFFTAPFLHFCFPPNFLESLYLIWPICPFLFVIFPLSPQILELLFSPQDSYSLILSCLWWSVCRSQFWKHFMIFFFFDVTSWSLSVLCQWEGRCRCREPQLAAVSRYEKAETHIFDRFCSFNSEVVNHSHPETGKF